MNLLALPLAMLIGVSLGLLGGGGSTLAVPVLVYVARLPVKPAIATSLLVVGAAALMGAVRHFRAGNVDGRAALLFGTISMACAYGGARLAVFVSDSVQLVAFALIMFIVAVSMLRPRAPRGSESRPSLLPVAAAAAVVGVLTGIVGVGGGFLIVPALVLFAALGMKRAIGTSLVVISANCAAGFLGYVGKVAIDWGIAALFVALAVAGVFIGTALAGRTNELALRKGFAVFLLLVAVLILVERREVLIGSLSGPRAAVAQR
jgi:uncharacterized protein